MKLKIFKENLAEVNSYLLIKKSESILIDPGFNGKDILDYLEKNEIELTYVILTHGHFDHIKSIEVLAKKYNFELFISKEDKLLLFDDTLNYAKSFGSTFKLPNLKINEVEDNQTIDLLEKSFLVIKTPGHTKGSICILYKDKLFSGDTLFFNSIGRTDLYSGNQTEIFKSLEKLSRTISNDVKVYPGHGESGKMKEIKEVNPYIHK